MRTSGVTHSKCLFVGSYYSIRITRLAFFLPDQFFSASLTFDDDGILTHFFFSELMMLIMTNVEHIIAVIMIAFMSVPLVMPL